MEAVTKPHLSSLFDALEGVKPVYRGRFGSDVEDEDDGVCAFGDCVVSAAETFGDLKAKCQWQQGLSGVQGGPGDVIGDDGTRWRVFQGEGCISRGYASLPVSYTPRTCTSPRAGSDRCIGGCSASCVAILTITGPFGLWTRVGGPRSRRREPACTAAVPASSFGGLRFLRQS